MDLFDKLTKGEKLNDMELNRLKSMLEWAINTGYQCTNDLSAFVGDLCGEKTKNDEKEGLILKKDFVDEYWETNNNNLFMKEDENISKVITASKSTKIKENRWDKYGKILGVEGDKGTKDARGRNISFDYGKDITCDESELVVELGKKIKDSTVRSLGGGLVHVYRQNRIRITQPDKYKIGGTVPEIRTFSYQMLKEKIDVSTNSAGASALHKLLLDPVCGKYPELEAIIKTTIENINVLYYSEYILSCVFFGFLLNLGQSIKWKDLQIFSVDTKMEERKIDDAFSNFRCDLLLAFKGALFVVEFKFRFDRPQDTGTQAIDCIIAKQYPSRALKFLQFNYPELFESINQVYGIGIGYNNYEGKILSFVKTIKFEKTFATKEEIEAMKQMKESIIQTRNMLKKKRKAGKKEKKIINNNIKMEE